MTERDLQRWSREVAEDPGAPSFIRLARAYRRQGRRDAARDIVLGGLTQHPEHVDGHAVLALLHIEDGEREQARDEWETVLRLDPGNFDASRGLGFLALERGDLGAARRHLDLAAAARPDDPAVSQARQVLERREQAAVTAAAATPAGPATRAPQEPSPSAGNRDPVRLFTSLTGEAAFMGALVLDDQGLVLAGRLEGEDHADDLLGALLATTVAEATRTAEMLRLGSWEDLLLETPAATLHLTALDGGVVVVVVAEPETPPGWVVRAATRAVSLTRRFMEVGQ